jgi:hypothetical protein
MMSFSVVHGVLGNSLSNFTGWRSVRRAEDPFCSPSAGVFPHFDVGQSRQEMNPCDLQPKYARVIVIGAAETYLASL